MKQLLAIAFITLLALGMGCAWISPSSQAASDGIQVHGHWTMTVSNPDGSVDAVHEFDNALLSSGRNLLARLLTGEYFVDKVPESVLNWPPPTSDSTTSPGWYIILKNQSSKTGVLNCDQGVNNIWGNNVETRLTSTLKREAATILIGAVCTVTSIADSADGTYNIGSVSTLVANSPTVNNNANAGLTINPLTKHDLPDPIVVDDQQHIAINVTITFE